MLPWFESELAESRSRSPGGDWQFADCAKCHKTQAKTARQSWGCVFEGKPPECIPVVPWDHPGRPHDPSEYDEHGKPRLQVCAGYVCRLPEVLETSRARMHWEKGNLAAFCGDEPPHDRLLECIEVLESSLGAYQRYEMNKDKKP